MSDRADAVSALIAKGFTPERAEAFLDLLASGLRRRGWADGEPLSDDERRKRIDTLWPPP